MTVAGLWRLWALAMLAAVLAMVAWDGGAPQEPPLVRPAARLPDLPPLPAYFDPRESVDALGRSSLWGPPAATAGAAAPAAAAAPEWALSGYVATPAGRSVLLSFENGAAPAQQLQRGQRLPDGSVILAIEPDRVRVRLPGGRAAADAPAAGPATAWIPIGPGLALPGR